jgi:hypothetical protein
MKIRFRDKAFCFTGKFVDLKRSMAAQETRARGGFTCDIVNERLDYLVVGSMPSPGWKFGNYGRKIETARELLERARRPRLVSESAFMEALAECPPENSGAIDAKVLLMCYHFVAETDESYDEDALHGALKRLHNDEGCHVTVKGWYVSTHNDLFAEDESSRIVAHEYALAIECRVVKHMSLAESPARLVNALETAMQAIRGVDGALRWSERHEGSAEYIRLLRQVPEAFRIEGL